MSFRELAKILSAFERRGNIPQRFVIEGVPYFSQWESPTLARKIIRDEISAREDPLWKRSGARSPQEYKLWSSNMCGMACLKMIIKHKFGKDVPTITLGKMCMEFGGYEEKTETIDGLYYSPFLRFISHEFGLRGKVAGILTLNRIMKELAQGNYVIASVSYKIRNPESKPATVGGHLVLVLGYDIEKKVLFFHNPSGDTKESQEYAQVSFLQFERFFAGRGIVIKK
ncbi:MAG: C39 family peptidase [Patescibacteria group bacterium]